jgi:lipid II:glycine glycyltransferase (peptidoglycan interpeptide bridge formation enzyme)
MNTEDSIRVSPVSLRELDGNDEPLQTGYWARFKERFGWTAHPISAHVEGNTLRLLFLTRKIAASRVLAYVPFGPAYEPTEKRETYLKALAGAALPLLPKGTFAVRFDLPWHRCGLGNFPGALSAEVCLRKAAMDIQPASTVILDIRGAEQEIMDRMKHKTRYNIRLAFRKGIEIEEHGEEGLETWYGLHEETGVRDRIAVHSLEYYRCLFRLVEEYGEGAPDYRILLAAHEGEILAGIIAAFRGKRAWYPYGASSRRKRNYMPTYALQWRAIQMARERGCESYDLYGISPSDDRSHPLGGLFRFKVGFGGTILNRPGCYDAVLERLPYFLFRKAEILRRYYYLGFRKRGFTQGG